MGKVRSPTRGESAGLSEKGRELVVTIVRASQKALFLTLGMMALGFLGGLIAIWIKPEAAEGLSAFAKVFAVPIACEISIYGAGSALENVQKIKTQVDKLSPSDDDEASG